MLNKRLYGMMILIAGIMLAFTLVGCDLLNGEKDPDVPGPGPGGDGGAIDDTWLASHNYTIGTAGKTTSYTVSGALTVPSGKNLIIHPGTTITFTTSFQSGIDVREGGCITAQGTASKHITLNGSSTTKGSWGRVTISSTANNVLDYVDILYSGNGGNSDNCALYLTGSASITNCVIDGSANNGIYIWSDGLTAFEGNTIKNCNRAPIYLRDSIYNLRNISGNNTFTGNTTNYVHCISSDNSQDSMTLKKLTIPYYFERGLEFTTSGKTLAIQPGTQILVGVGERIFIGENANLVAVGTPSDRIVFRGSDERAGWWSNIHVESRYEGTKFAYCDITGGGRGSDWWNKECLEIYNGTVELFNVKISKSAYYGIELDRDYKIWSQFVTFENCPSGNVWYNNAAAAALPANNFTPSTPLAP